MNYQSYMCRAKSVETNKWVYGYYVYHINRTLCPIGDSVKPEDEEHYITEEDFSDWNMPRGIHLVKIRIETLCRCVGIKDRHGIMIYENDMLDAPYNIVSYTANVNDSLGMNAGWYLQRDNFESWSEMECRDDYEIIGNTVDNSELLKH